MSIYEIMGFDKDEILFYDEWLLNTTEKQLRLLLYISMHANDENICRCSLKNIRSWLELSSKGNNATIKTILNELEKMSYISCKRKRK